MKNIVYFLLLVAAISCSDAPKATPTNASKTPAESIDTNGLNIDATIIRDIQNNLKKKPVALNREVWNYDKEGNETHYFLKKGLVFKFINDQKAHAIFNTYHDKIVAGNNYIFLTNMDFDESYNTYYDIVIIEGADPFKIIEQIGTNGVNYDVYNSDVVTQLKAWDAQVDFKFVVMDVARIHAYMKTLPNDLAKFTSEVYKFCPDVIDQGYSSMKEMITDYKSNKYFWLWWD
ncbi:MAG: DUF4253 domain-containing protein [Bacteroidota bacterium]